MSSYGSMILSDGNRSLELIKSSNWNDGIFLVEFTPPVPVPENTYAEGVDSDGRRRVRTRYSNPTGSGVLRVVGDAASFWDHMDNLQELVLSAHRNKGTVTYDAPRINEAVTLDLESIHLAEIPHDTARRLSVAVPFEFECQPFGRLDPVTLFTGEVFTGPIDSVEVPAVAGHVEAFGELTVSDFANYEARVLALSPALYWPLTDATGANDHSGNGRNGTGAGGVTIGGSTSSGIAGETNSTNFDGTDDYISSSYDPFLTGSTRTFAGWANRDTSSSGDVLFGSGGTNAVLLRINSGGTTVGFWADSATGGHTWASAWPSSAQWVHWALVFNDTSNVAELFINGVSKGTVTEADPYNANSTNFQAAAYGTGGEAFDGKMAHVAVWGSALTANQIATLASEGPGHNSDLIEVGYEQEGYDPDDPSPLLIEGGDLVTTDFAGSSSTETGSHSANTVAATLATSEVIVCSTGPQPHYGKKRISVRAIANGDVKVRLKWRVGDGPLTSEEWQTIPAASAWYELTVGALRIRQVASGTQSWEGFIEAKAATLGTNFEIDFVEIMPAEVWSRARGIQSSTTSSRVVAYDGFDQSAGALNGKTAPLGGNWASDGDATDFAVEATGHTAQRSEVSDAQTGRFALLGSAVASCAVQVDMKWTATPSWLSNGLHGVLARFVDTSNYLLGGFFTNGNQGFAAVYKCVSGTLTSLGSVMPSPYYGVPNFWRTLRLDVGSGGSWALAVRFDTTSEFIAILAGSDSILATGGTLDDGRVGFYDEYTAASPASIRNFDNFIAYDLAATSTISGHALHSGQSATFNHDSIEREDEVGTSSGRVPRADGSLLRLPPSTRNDTPGRLVVKRRRYTTGILSDGLNDALSGVLVVTPRVLLSG